MGLRPTNVDENVASEWGRRSCRLSGAVTQAVLPPVSYFRSSDLTSCDGLPLISIHHFADLSIRDHLPVIQPHRTIAHLSQQIRRMRYAQHRLSAPPQLLHALEAARLKRLVPNRD